MLTLPAEYVVNPLKRMRLARILASKYEFLLFAKDCGTKKYQLIPLEGSTWKKVQVENQRTAESNEIALWSSEQNEAVQFV